MAQDSKYRRRRYLHIDGDLTKLAVDMKKDNLDFDKTIGTEVVYEKGFTPNEGFKFKPYEVFDEWMEIVLTYQVVAIEYDPEKHLD